jgi:hypothetical protein
VGYCSVVIGEFSLVLGLSLKVLDQLVSEFFSKLAVAAAQIRTADCVVIAVGAGFGVDSGLLHINP